VLLQLRRPGYRAQLLKLDGDWSGRVLLEPGVFELPEIKVTGRYAKPARYAGTTKYDDYFRRRRIGPATRFRRSISTRYARRPRPHASSRSTIGSSLPI